MRPSTTILTLLGLILLLGLQACTVMGGNEAAILREAADKVDEAPDSVYATLAAQGYDENGPEIPPRMVMRYAAGRMAVESGDYVSGLSYFAGSFSNSRRLDNRPWMAKTTAAMAEMLRSDSILHSSTDSAADSGIVVSRPVLASVLENVSAEMIDHDAELERRSRNNVLYLIIGAIVAIVIAVGGIMYIRRLRRSHGAALSGLRTEESAISEEKMRQLMTDTYREMDEKCRKYYAYGSTEAGKKLTAEIAEIRRQLADDPANVAEIESRVDRFQNNLIADFRSDLPSLKSDDYRLLLYSVLGFSIPAIAVLLREEKVDAVYNRKARLKTKIRRLPDETISNRYLHALK